MWNSTLSLASSGGCTSRQPRRYSSHQLADVTQHVLEPLRYHCHCHRCSNHLQNLLYLSPSKSDSISESSHSMSLTFALDRGGKNIENTRSLTSSARSYCRLPSCLASACTRSIANPWLCISDRTISSSNFQPIKACFSWTKDVSWSIVIRSLTFTQRRISIRGM